MAENKAETFFNQQFKTNVGMTPLNNQIPKIVVHKNEELETLVTINIPKAIASYANNYHNPVKPRLKNEI